MAAPAVISFKNDRRASSFFATEERKLKPKLPSNRADFKYDQVLSTLLNGVWQERRIIVTECTIYFALVNDEYIRDHIPMEEITAVEIMRTHKETDSFSVHLRESHSKRRLEVQKPIDDCKDLSATSFQVRTVADGFNSGRIYYLQTSSCETCEEIVQDLKKLVHTACKRAEKASKFRKCQKLVLSVYQSVPFQNFAVSIVGAQIATPDANTVSTLNKVDIFLIIAFATELCVNAFANWFEQFKVNLWNWFDVLIVSLSLVGLTPAGLSLRIVLLLRSCRVLRIFGKLKAVTKIFSALSYAVMPMANAFFIIFVISAIYSIVGVTYYSDMAPEQFGTFARAFIAMFRITIGSVEWWFQDFPAIHDNGTINFWPSLFLVSYVIVVNWVFFQVSIAVLLDNFLTASNDIKAAERLKVIQEHQAQKQVKNPLDPLLLKLSKDYMNDAGLSLILQDLFKNGVQSKVWRLRRDRQDFSPRIFISDSDFIAMTNNGALCNSRGQLGPAEFERVMREQMLYYTQSRLSAASEFWNTSDQDFTELGTLKQILMEQLSIRREQEEARRELRELLLCTRSVVSKGSLRPAAAFPEAAAVSDIAADFDALKARVTALLAAADADCKMRESVEYSCADSDSRSVSLHSPDPESCQMQEGTPSPKLLRKFSSQSAAPTTVSTEGRSTTPLAGTLRSDEGSGIWAGQPLRARLVADSDGSRKGSATYSRRKRATAPAARPSVTDVGGGGSSARTPGDAPQPSSAEVDAGGSRSATALSDKAAERIGSVHAPDGTAPVAAPVPKMEVDSDSLKPAPAFSIGEDWGGGGGGCTNCGVAGRNPGAAARAGSWAKLDLTRLTAIHAGAAERLLDGELRLPDSVFRDSDLSDANPFSALNRPPRGGALEGHGSPPDHMVDGGSA